MDELEFLRRTRSDVIEPTVSAVDRGRTALLLKVQEELGSNTGHARKRRHPIRWAGLGVLGAGALVVTLVLTNVVGLAGWRGGADPAAAAVLNDAALAAVKSSDSPLLPGQYMLVKTDAVYGVVTAIAGGANQRSGSYLTISHSELYVPASRADDWVWIRSMAAPYKTFGAESAKIAQKEYATAQAKSKGRPEILRAAAGRFYGTPHTTADLQSLPRDPQQLLDYIYHLTSGQGRSADGMALGWIADTLRSGVAPADLRAALYRAAAGISGVEITEQRANLNGRTGIAIGRVETADNTRQDIIIDPSNGQLIGERQVTLNGGWGFPAGTVTEWTAVTTTIVDSAPSGGTPNGSLDVDGCNNLGNGSFQCASN